MFLYLLSTGTRSVAIPENIGIQVKDFKTSAIIQELLRVCNTQRYQGKK